MHRELKEKKREIQSKITMVQMLTFPRHIQRKKESLDTYLDEVRGIATFQLSHFFLL